MRKVVWPLVGAFDDLDGNNILSALAWSAKAKSDRAIAALSQEYLLSGGHLVLEHGFMQADDVSSIMKRYGYINIASHCDLANKPRFVVGCKAS